MGKAPVAGSSGASNGASNFHGSLEEATELEYLRNILFEYMMGRQPAVRLIGKLTYKNSVKSLFSLADPC